MKSSPGASQIRIDLVADLQKWRAFLAIGELGSLTRAALFLDSNQSFLSRQLNALERDCGTRLFIRTGRGVELSDVGQRIFLQVKELLEGAQRLEQEILGEAQEPTGIVTLGILPSIGHHLVAPLFSQLRGKHEAIRLKIVEGSSGQVEEWLADERVDIAILYRYGASLPPHEQSLAVVDSYLIGAIGEPLSARGMLPFSDLRDLPYILPSAPNGLRTALDAVARQERITLEPVIEADSLPLQKSLVETEGLFTVLPLHAVWSEVSEKKLQAARIVNPSLERHISMALAKTKGPAKAVSAVAAQIRQLVEEMAIRGMWRPGQVEGDYPLN